MISFLPARSSYKIYTIKKQWGERQLCLICTGNNSTETKATSKLTWAKTPGISQTCQQIVFYLLYCCPATLPKWLLKTQDSGSRVDLCWFIVLIHKGRIIHCYVVHFYHHLATETHCNANKVWFTIKPWVKWKWTKKNCFSALKVRHPSSDQMFRIRMLFPFTHGFIPFQSRGSTLWIFFKWRWFCLLRNKTDYAAI